MIIFSLTKHVRRKYQPKRRDVNLYLRAALICPYKNVSVDFSIVDSPTSQELNQQYRNKPYPTNVISLEYPNIRNQHNALIGELILCDEVIVKEALEQEKTILNHYAHLIIHGMLHLQGIDHITPEQESYMENLEIKILQQFGIDNPYEINSN